MRKNLAGVKVLLNKHLTASPYRGNKQTYHLECLLVVVESRASGHTIILLKFCHDKMNKKSRSFIVQ